MKAGHTFGIDHFLGYGIEAGILETRCGELVAQDSAACKPLILRIFVAFVIRASDRLVVAGAVGSAVVD